MYNLLKGHPHATVFVLTVALYFLVYALFQKSKEVPQFGFATPLFKTRKIFLLIAIAGVLWALIHL